jgi:hypothetical protein
MFMYMRNSIYYLLIGMIALLFFPARCLAGDDSTNEASAATPETDKWRKGEVDAFVNEMSTATGWTVSWSKTDCSKKRYTDDNNSWIDASDIHFHAGHGGDVWDWGYLANKCAITFKGTQIVPSQAQSSGHGIWGNNDLEWLGLTCCSLLKDSSYKCWAASMDKLHLFLGFKTTSYSYEDGRFARGWAQEMKRKATITQAWFTSTDQNQKAGVVARVMAEESVNFDDHLNNYGSVSADPSPNSTFYYRDHPCASPPYLMVTPPLTSMREYNVVSRTVNSAYVAAIATAFGMPTSPIQEDTYYYFITTSGSNPRVLLVHRGTGLYYYYDTSRLWNTTYDLTHAVYPLVQAYSQAESFYSSRSILYRETTGAYEVETDTYSTVDNGSETPIPTTTTVVYSRQVEADSGRVASIAGAGAKTKLYIAQDGSPMGGMGNWRQVQWSGAMVPVLDKVTTWNLFVVHGMQMTVSPLSIKYDSVSTDIGTATQAYFELPGGMGSQTKLIPIWIFKVDYSLAGQVTLAAADTFVYAAQTMAPPIAVIDAPADGSSFTYPQQITFQGNVVAGFGTPPYSYHWDSDLDGSLGDGQTYTPANSLSLGCSWDAGTSVLQPLPHRISLTVTDAAGLTNTDTITVTITGGACGADLDHNGVIDLGDFAVFAQYWLATTTSGE